MIVSLGDTPWLAVIEVSVVGEEDVGGVPHLAMV